MKIYFAGSIRGGRQDAGIYAAIIQHLASYGEVLTEHVGDLTLSSIGDDGPNDRFIHDRDIQYLTDSDIMVAEVTCISMGVGYEIGRAVERGIPILCLFRPKSEIRLSAMISGCSDLSLMEYSSHEEARMCIDQFLLNKRQLQ